MPGAVVLGCDDSDHDVALVGQATQTRWLASRDRRQYLVVAAVIAVNAVVIGLQYYGATVDGAPPDNVLACNSVVAWNVASKCGIGAQDCLPFSSDQWQTARCPAGCVSGYQKLVPIGSSPYRADSGICLSATHSGLIGPLGGCFKFRLSGSAPYFSSSYQNGIQSVEFPAPFPMSYVVEPADSTTLCRDIWVVLLPIVLLLSMAALLAVRVGARTLWIGIVAAGAIYTAGVAYAQIDPVPFARLILNNGTVLGGFSWLLWECGGRHQIGNSIEKRPLHLFLYYIVPYFVFLNIDFLSAISPVLNFGLDYKLSLTSPLLITFLVMLLLLVVVSLAYMVRRIREAGVLRSVGALYLQTLGPIIVIIVLLGLMSPGSVPHYHHYAFALSIWPLASVRLPPNRWTMMMQASLLSLFVNGALRWGLASPLDLVPSNAVNDWRPEPVLSAGVIKNNVASINVSWQGDAVYPVATYSLRLDDVELYRGPDNAFTLASVSTDVRYKHKLVVVEIAPSASPESHGTVYFGFEANGTLVVAKSMDELKKQTS